MGIFDQKTQSIYTSPKLYTLGKSLGYTAPTFNFDNPDFTPRFTTAVGSGFNPDQGKEEAYDQYLLNLAKSGNKKINLNKAQKKFDQYWDGDVDTRKAQYQLNEQVDFNDDLITGMEVSGYTYNPQTGQWVAPTEPVVEEPVAPTKPKWTPKNATLNAGDLEYTVKEGNTLWQITNEYNKKNGTKYTWQEMQQKLGIADPTKLKIGQRLDFSKLNPVDQGNSTQNVVNTTSDDLTQSSDSLTMSVDTTSTRLKKGGNVKKHQSGGTLSPEQQELQYALVGYVVATKKQPKDENEIKQITQQLIQLKQQDPQKYNQLVQLGQQAQAQKVEKGAKLNYIKSLKGQCPEGEELVYFKKGGMIGCGCQKKEIGGEVKSTKKLNPIEEFKKGRKTKKC